MKLWLVIQIFSKKFNCTKQADYLFLYEQNWLKEGTEALVLKQTAASSKEKPIQTDKSD